MPHAVLVSGATGTGAASINGVYRPVAGEGVGGKPVYKKDGADMWIEYWPGTDSWQLKSGSDKGMDSSHMCSLGNQKEAGVVEEVTAGWNVYDSTTKVWSEQAGVRVVRYAAAVQVSGATGSNASTKEEGEDVSQQELDDIAAAVAESLALSQAAPTSLPSASAHPVTRVKRWGDGLEAPAAGSRYFFPPGFMVTRDVQEAIKAFGHSPAQISEIMDAGRAKAAMAANGWQARCSYLRLYSGFSIVYDAHVHHAHAAHLTNPHRH
jgi:hypothetical protein